MPGRRRRGRRAAQRLEQTLPDHELVPGVAGDRVDRAGEERLEPDRLGLHLYPREREAWRGTWYRLTHEDDLFFHGGVLYAKAVDLAWVLDVNLYEEFVEMAVVFDGIGDLRLEMA